MVRQRQKAHLKMVLHLEFGHCPKSLVILQMEHGPLLVLFPLLVSKHIQAQEHTHGLRLWAFLLYLSYV
jgi:hypothetical protein